mgnify:FL=1
MGGNRHSTLSNLIDAMNISESEALAARGPRGIQSVEVGGTLLIALAHRGRALPLKELAKEAGMVPAKAHPYLVSFIKIGMIEQDTATGHYGLGPLALQLGLISLQQYDPIRLATPRIEELAAQINHTVAICVWGNRGPTVVRVAEAPSAVHVTMRHGTVVSLRNTASGRLFAAYLPSDVVRQAMEQEALASGSKAVAAIDAEFEKTLQDTRRHRLSRIAGTVVPALSAMAAPVFNQHGELVLGIVAMGPGSLLDPHLDGKVARPLRLVADELSRQLA